MYSCTLELKTFHYSLLNKNKELIYSFVNNFADFVHITGGIIVPKKSKKFVVLRSPFVHKKIQEHFDIGNYKLIIKIQTTNQEILTMIINYIQKKLFLNFEIKIIQESSYNI